MIKTRLLILSFIISFILVSCKEPVNGEGFFEKGPFINKEIKIIQDNILEYTIAELPEEEHLMIEDIIKDISIEELEELETNISEYFDLLNELKTQIEADPEYLISNRGFGFGSLDYMKNYVSSVFSDDLAGYKKAFITSGLGFNHEVLAGFGIQGSVVVVAGGFVEINSSGGIGRAYDFTNFVSYDYTTASASIGGGIKVGVGAGVSGSLSGIYSNSFMIGNSKDQEYKKTVGTGIQASIGVEASLILGLNLSPNISYTNIIDCPLRESYIEQPQGASTGVKSISFAKTLSISGGTETEITTFIGAGKTWVITEPDISTFQDYLTTNNPSRSDILNAGLKMGTEIMLNTPMNIFSLTGSLFSILYGLWYNEEYFMDNNIVDNATSPTAIAGDGLVTLSWTDPVEYDHIEIWYEIDGVYTKFEDQLDSQGTIIGSLTNDVTYIFKIITYSLEGKPSDGLELSVVPQKNQINDTTPPSEVVGFAPMTEGNTVILNWTNPSDTDFDHVEIWYGEGVADIEFTGNINDGVAVINDLSDNTEYIFLIKTVDSSSNVSYGVSAVVEINNDAIIFTSTRDGNNEIYSMDLDGGNELRLTNNLADDTFASLSPNKKRIIFVSDRDGDKEIYTMDSNGSDLIQLTNNSFKEDFPSCSSDGSRIVFTSWKNGIAEIFIMDSDGGNEVRVGKGYCPSFSDDGNKIIFSLIVDREMRLYIMDSDGGNQTKILESSDYGFFFANWSPDGSKIVFSFQSMKDGSHNLGVMNSDGSNQISLYENCGFNNRASWSRDGNKIIFTSDNEIYTIDTDGDNLVQLTNNSFDDFYPYWY